jgi:hypothetical protein
MNALAMHCRSLHCRSLLVGVLTSSLASLASAQTPPAGTPAPPPPPSAASPAPAPAAASSLPPAPASASASAGSSVAIDSVEGGDPLEPSSRAGRFEGGLRSGLGFGVGKAGDNASGRSRDLNDIVEWRVPIWIDIGYRLSEALTLGVYTQLGFGGGGDCGGSCNSSDLRIGVQMLWHAGSGPLWLGAGLGYEWQSLYALRVSPDVPITLTDADNVRQLASRVGETLGGPELTLQAGLDFELEPGLGLGPYVAASVGQYATDDFDCDQITCPTGSSIDGPSNHAWFGIGVRGSYAP